MTEQHVPGMRRERFISSGGGGGGTNTSFTPKLEGIWSFIKRVVNLLKTGESCLTSQMHQKPMHRKNRWPARYVEKNYIVPKNSKYADVHDILHTITRKFSALHNVVPGKVQHQPDCQSKEEEEINTFTWCHVSMWIRATANNNLCLLQSHLIREWMLILSIPIADKSQMLVGVMGFLTKLEVWSIKLE